MNDVALHTERLEYLARLLEKPTRGRKFDMNVYGSHPLGHTPEEDNFCGTAACALGTAALDPMFIAQGLRMEWLQTMRSHMGTIWFDEMCDTTAGAKFFGLTGNEATDLFLGIERSKKDVIARIRYYARYRAERKAVK